jgi:hypothetical protein
MVWNNDSLTHPVGQQNCVNAGLSGRLVDPDAEKPDGQTPGEKITSVMPPPGTLDCE